MARGFPDYFFFLLPMGVNDGGTGATSFTQNGVLLGNGTNIIGATGAGAADQVLRVPGAGGAPAFGAVDLSKAAAVTGLLAVANGGTGTASPALVAGAGITITGTWPANTIALTTPVSVANGGTGTATPSLLGGTNIAISGTWPNQQVAFSGILAVGSGGSGTATPALVQGTGMTITGSWPNQTVALSTPVAIANGGTGTSTGSITGPGALTFTAGGAAADISLTPSTTGQTVATSAAQAILALNNSSVNLGATIEYKSSGTRKWLAGMGASAFGDHWEVYSDTAVDYGLRISATAGTTLKALGTNQSITLTPSGTGVVTTTKNITTSAQLASTVATGTAPLAVTSTTQVTNLNAERVAGTQVTNSATLGALLIGSGTGTAAWGKPDGARVYHSVNQNSTSGANLMVAFNSERYDNGGLHDTVTNNSRLTAQKEGKYLITGHVEVAANANGRRKLNVLLNNTAYIAETQVLPHGTSVDLLSVATLYHLAVNDYVELVFFQDSTATLAVSAVGNYTPEFAMQWLGP